MFILRFLKNLAFHPFRTITNLFALLGILFILYIIGVRSGWWGHWF